MAWFVKLAIDNHWIGPLGRVLIGLVAGAGLIAWSERFRARGYIAFAYSLKATGSGILYIALWAAFSLFHLVPASVAFVAMIAVTAFNGFLAWIQESELLALYAILGGLITPVLVSTGGNHEITLFSYLLMLDVAVLVLVALRPWSRLLFAAFIGTVIFVLGWWLEFYSQAQIARTAFFLECFFLIFAFAPRLVRLNLDRAGSLPTGTISPWSFCPSSMQEQGSSASTRCSITRQPNGPAPGWRSRLPHSTCCWYACQVAAHCTRVPRCSPRSIFPPRLYFSPSPFR
jgi:uncharacterized membrane protein